MKERLVKAPSFLFTKSKLGKGLKDRRSDFLKIKIGGGGKGELVEKMQIYCKIGTLPRSKICMLSQNVMGCGSEETTVSHSKSPLIRTDPHPHTAGQSPGDEQ